MNSLQKCLGKSDNHFEYFFLRMKCDLKKGGLVAAKPIFLQDLKEEYFFPNSEFLERYHHTYGGK